MGTYNSVVNMQHLASQYEAAASLHDPAALTQARSKVLAYVYDHAGSTSHKLRALRLMADEANPMTDNGIFGWIHYARTSDGIRMAKYRV
ncbi:hypothetical protein AA105894_2563 [Asaia spathodeae NBRC 105894]|nr:hypothetical protein AA105894_2563 [Asaia spathodeae NBRC 105894]